MNLKERGKALLIGLVCGFSWFLYCCLGAAFAEEVIVPGLSLETASSNTITGNVLSNGNPATAQYYVERSSDSFFNTEVVPVQDWTTATGFTASGLVPGTTYFFRVKARDLEGNESAWSPVVSKITVPAAPTGVSATTNDPFKVTISWTKTKGATGYIVFRNNVSIATLGDVNVYEDYSASAPTISEGTVTASKGTYADYVSLTLTGAKTNNGFNHSYQVAAYNESGNGAKSGNVSGFRKPGPLQVQWMRSLGDNYYSFAYLEGATGNSFLDTGAPMYAVYPPKAITVEHKVGTPDTLIISFSGASVTAGEGRYYYTQLRADGANPILVSSIRDRGYRHDSIANTEGFEIFSSVSEAGPFTPIGLSSATSFEDSGLSPNTRYWYKVRAKSTAGTWSNLSMAASKFTFAAVPGINLGETGMTAIAGTIAANGNPSGTQYCIEMAADPDFLSGVTQVQNWSSSTSYVAADLHPGTTYYFRVKARNEDGVETEWSAVQGKTTLPANLPPTVELLTEDGSCFSAGVGEVTLRWSSDDPDEEDFLTHTVLIRPPAASDVIAIVRSSGPGGQSHTFAIEDKTLWPVGVYYWWVTTEESNGLITTSSERTFQIINDPPEQPGPFNDFGSLFKGGSTVFLSWGLSGDQNGDLVRYEVDFYNGSAWISVRGLENEGAPLANLLYCLPENNTGQAKFRVRAHEGSVYSPYRESPSFIVDSEPPTVPTIILKENGKDYHPGALAEQPVTFTLGGSADNLTGVIYQYSLDAGINWISGETGVITAAGQTLLSFRAADGAGNLSAEQQAVVLIEYKTEPVRPRNGTRTGSNPSLVDIRVDGTRVEGIIDAYQYKTMAEKDSLGVITITAGKVSFFLPLSEIDVPALAAELGASSAKELKIHVIWQQLDEERAHNIKGMVENLGGKPLGFSTNFTFILAADNGNKKEIQGFKSYVTRLIKLDTGVEPQGLAAVWVNLKTNELIPVPTSFEIREGKTEVIIKHQGTGTYTLISTPPKVFLDITSHWAREEIESLSAKLIINGKNEGTFDPHGNVTRAEFTAMLVRSLGLTARGQAHHFNDVGSQWYGGVVRIAAGAGLVQGYDDGSFRPNNYITREEIAVILARALFNGGFLNNDNRGDAGLAEFQDAGDISPWAVDELAIITRAQILRGNAEGRLFPTQNATRAEAAVMLKRMLNFGGLSRD
ncbi:MAG: S-layer homology domain-containing protein [Bacillota bacterium]